MMPTVQDVLKRELDKFVQSGEVSMQAALFFAAVSATIFAVATHVDLLCDQLIAKGIDLSL